MKKLFLTTKILCVSLMLLSQAAEVSKTKGPHVSKPSEILMSNDSKELNVVLEPDIQTAIDSVYPALVQIHVVMYYHDGGREKKGEGTGSGAIISPEGYVITNHHVAGKAKALRCVLSTKEELPATLVGTDALSDISVLKLDLSSRPAGSPPLPVARFGSSAALKVGDVVLAMGCPLSLSHSVTKGIIANKEMMIPRLMERRGVDFTIDGENVGSLVKWLGHDATIQPGNSGGPLVNLAGEIVGINELGIGNMGGAIPSDLAKNVAEELIKHGSVRRSWIGAHFQPLLKGGIHTSQGIIPRHPETPGALVGGVIPDGPAEKAGLKTGDIVVAVDNQPIKVHFREELPFLNMLILSKPIGETVRFKILRDGKEKTISLKTEAREDAQGKESEVKEWGLVVQNITTQIAKEMQRPNKEGVLVKSVRPGGASDRAVPAVMESDVIIEIDGSPILNKEEFLKATNRITKDKRQPVPSLVTIDRKDERLLTLVEVGIREPQDPTQEARKPWLPFATQVVSKKLASALGLNVQKGVRITQIYPNPDDSKLDFQIGDILTHIDGNLIEASEPQDSRVFEETIQSYRIGSTVEISLLREGKPYKVPVLLTEKPKPQKEFKPYESVELEFKARDISYFDRIKNRWKNDESGVVVSEVDAGGWASVSGLMPGDLVQEVNGEKIQGIEEFKKIMQRISQEKSKQNVFLVKRGVRTLFLELEFYPTTKS